MTRILTSLLLAGSLVGIGLATTAARASDIRTERVQFPKGEIGATIKNRIRGRETVDYRLRARAGQFMSVGLRSDNSSNYFNVMAPGETDVAFFIGSTEGNEYEGDLPESCDYTIRVYLMRNAARRGETANYTLDVAIAAAGDVPSEADGRGESGHSVGGAHRMDPNSLLGIRGRNLDSEEIDGKPGAPLAAEVLGTKIHTADPDEMQYIILRKLTNRYAADRGIEVKPEEIDAYVESLERFMEQDRKQRKARREEIARKLESKNLTEEERKRLSAELDTLNKLLADQDATAGGAAEDRKETKAVQEQLGSAFILQWKINRALYQQYGGRIIFQQGGPEPLDAYRKFLEEQEQQGAFKILNKEFEPRFWRYYVTDSIHSFYPAGSEEEAQAFQTHWWLIDTP